MAKKTKKEIAKKKTEKEVEEEAPPKYKTGKVKFNKKAAQAYAQHILELEDVPTAKKDLIEAIEEGTVDLEFSCEKCEAPLDELSGEHGSPFCWFCNDDLTDDGTGGVDNYLASLEEEEEEEDEDGEEEEDEEDEDDEEEEEDEDDEEEEDEDDEEDEDGEEEEDEDEDENEEDEEEKPKKGGLTIKQHVKEIKKLDRASGEAAYDIGVHLADITDGKKFQDMGYERFPDFCAAELGYTQQTATGLIRVSQAYDKKTVGQLGITRALLLVNAPEKVQKKLMKKLKDGTVKALKMTAKEVKAVVKEARTNEGTSGKGGPKARSPYLPLLSQKHTIRKPPKGYSVTKTAKPWTVPMDDKVGLEISVTKKGSFKFQFVSLVAEESNTEESNTEE
jgi:hypothetical protein